MCASVSGTVVMQVTNNRMVDGPRLMYYTVVMMCTADHRKKKVILYGTKLIIGCLCPSIHFYIPNSQSSLLDVFLRICCKVKLLIYCCCV